ncbi:MAG: DUF1924 domain-containing protein [SAR324 cluster bacterium]|nr:DUF1924 domain-containing protein [SAR324 cluster bacterium]MBL7034753.1 DUF1924 domain-containing protein [SAR324 cluster bacterium]
MRFKFYRKARYQVFGFILVLMLSLSFGFRAQGQTPVSSAAKQVLESYLEIVRQEKPEFSGFDAKSGERFYFAEREHSRKGDSRSCALCHGDDPKSIGQHFTSGKMIKPLAPAANIERLTEVKKIDKWFRRNCKWTLERVCSTEEKGHFLTFLYSF